jgi:hypothetical protein
MKESKSQWWKNVQKRKILTSKIALFTYKIFSSSPEGTVLN